MNDNDNDKQSLIGVDPLAWLSYEEKQSVLSENTAPETSADPQAQTGSSYTVKLNSALTIRDVSGLMAELTQIDDDCSEIVFESAELERVDTAALQLLLGFYLSATHAAKTVIWHRPSEALCHAVEVLGLKDVFGIKSAAV